MASEEHLQKCPLGWSSTEPRGIDYDACMNVYAPDCALHGNNIYVEIGT